MVHAWDSYPSVHTDPKLRVGTGLGTGHSGEERCCRAAWLASRPAAANGCLASLITRQGEPTHASAPRGGSTLAQAPGALSRCARWLLQLYTPYQGCLRSLDWAGHLLPPPVPPRRRCLRNQSCC